MNNVSLVGRLTKDIELRVTPNNISTCTFTLAIDRGFKDAQGNKLTDFIQCVAWRKSAEFLNNYAKKGNIVGLTGSIQTRTYEKDGDKRYVTEVVADRVSLYSSNKGENVEEKAKEFAQENNVQYTSDVDTSDLSFY